VRYIASKRHVVGAVCVCVCVCACVRVYVYTCACVCTVCCRRRLRPPRDVSGRVSMPREESSFNCRAERKASDGFAEAGAPLRAPLRDQQNRAQQDAVPRQAHGHGHQGAGGVPKTQGIYIYIPLPRLFMYECVRARVCVCTRLEMLFLTLVKVIRWAYVCVSKVVSLLNYFCVDSFFFFSLFLSFFLVVYK